MDPITPTEPKKRTVTLTGRAPVAIVEDDWPIIAEASDHDGQVRSQANRAWWLKVRQHEDGRTLVYGGHETSMPHEHDLRGGYLLVASHLAQDLGAAVRQVADEIHAPEHLAQACLADLPPEEL